ncbi:glycosyltransferase [Brachybacterium tyrofermentans]|uniref:glycosyltransferase n=1 Tax=Brachybacterium tyrofermentans TaxID=47848 RepID=UPI003FCF0E66
MAHVLLAAMPFAGHVLPFVGVVRELQHHQHRVSFYTGVKYRGVVERSGATWIPFKQARDFDDAAPELSFPEMNARPGISSMLSSFSQIFFGTAPGQAQDIAELHRRDPVDAIISEGTCVGPSLAHEMLDIPYMTMSQAPMGLGIPRAVRFAMDHTINAVFTKMHNRARRSMGLGAAKRSGMEGTWSSASIVAQGTTSLEQPRKPLASYVRFIGDAAAGTRTTDPHPQWIDLLPADKPIVHVSEGSLGRSNFPLLTRTIEAIRPLDCHLVVGGIPETDLPKSVTAVDWVPQDLLFPRTALYVTNGGYGGVLAALGHGVPVLVVPGAQDKPLAAGNVARSGAGIQLKPRNATINRLTQSIESSLGNESLKRRAKEVAEEMAQAGGARRVVNVMESEVLRK